MRPADRNQDFWDLGLCVFTVFLALVLYAAPTRIIDGPDLMPAWPLMVVFLWSGMRPRFMHPVVVFFIGLIQDLLTGAPMGLWALSFMTAIAIARFRDEDGMPRDLPPIWVRFCLAMTIASAVAYLAGSWALEAFADWRPILIETAASILTFPLLAFISLRRRRGGRSGKFAS